jgi:hypothetical protein
VTMTFCVRKDLQCRDGTSDVGFKCCAAKVEWLCTGSEESVMKIKETISSHT